MSFETVSAAVFSSLLQQEAAITKAIRARERLSLDGEEAAVSLIADKVSIERLAVSLGYDSQSRMFHGNITLTEECPDWDDGVFSVNISITLDPETWVQDLEVIASKVKEGQLRLAKIKG